jgi:hypothetical protein
MFKSKLLPSWGTQCSPFKNFHKSSISFIVSSLFRWSTSSYRILIWISLFKCISSKSSFLALLISSNSNVIEEKIAIHWSWCSLRHRVGMRDDQLSLCWFWFHDKFSLEFAWRKERHVVSATNAAKRTSVIIWYFLIVVEYYIFSDCFRKNKQQFRIDWL